MNKMAITIKRRYGGLLNHSEASNQSHKPNGEGEGAANK